MLQSRSLLEVADNSGAKKLMLINIPGRSQQKKAMVGDVITCVVKEAAPQGNVKEDEIVKAVIVRTRKEHHRIDGSYVRFDDNAAVVIDNAGNPKGTRVFGPIAREVRDKGFLKIASLAMEVI